MSTLEVETTERVFISSPQVRCDRCSAQARGVAHRGEEGVDELLLYFCAHHLREYGNELAMQGFDTAEDYTWS